MAQTGRSTTEVGELVTFNCGHCCASLLIGADASRVTCMSCGSKIHILPSGGKKFRWAKNSLRAFNNRQKVGKYAYAYEDLENPELREFSKSFDFDSIFKDGEDEFDALLRLRHGIRNTWFEKRPSDSFLKRIGYWRSNRLNRYWHCSHVAYMFVLAASCLGITSRVVNVARKVKFEEDPMGHMVIDVWSNQYQKWVYMDVLFDFHYEDSAGIPLDLLEVRDRYWNRGRHDLMAASQRDINDCVPGKYSLSDPLNEKSEEFITRSLNTFWPIFYHGQNYFTHSIEERQVPILCYEDGLNSKKKIIGFGKEHYANEQMMRRTSRKIDVYPSINNAELSFYEIKGKPNMKRAYINTFTPNLKKVEWRVGMGRWKKYNEDGIDLRVLKDKEVLEARTQNRSGRYGAISRVEMT